MAAVKNRLKVFETAPDQENMASTKPQTPLKPPVPVFGQNMSPALQKFMNKQNEIIGAREVQGSPLANPDTWVKKPPQVPSKTAVSAVGRSAAAEQDEQNTQVTPASKPADSRRGSQVIVPNIFKQESGNAIAVSDSRRGSQVSVPEVFKQKSTDSETKAPDENKPKPTTKPGSSHPRPPAGPKPQASGSSKPPLPGSHTHTSQSITRKPNDVKSEEKPQNIIPRDSARVKLPTLDQVSLKPTQLGSTSSSSSASQGASGEVKGTDFRNILRPVKVEAANQSEGKPKPANMKPLLPPTLPVSSSQPNRPDDSDPSHSQPVHHPPSSPEVTSSQPDAGGHRWKPVSQELKRHSDTPVLERKNDSKKFKKLPLEAAGSLAPTKPVLPGNIDLALVTQQYHQMLSHASNTSSSVADIDGDVYDDGVSVADVIRRETSTKRQSTHVSMIPDMSAEEEEQELYDDGVTPTLPAPVLVPEADGLYVDAETERKDDELYEDEETFALSAEQLEEERKRRQKEEAEAKKREEKERREREKDEEKKRKKEEKERAKKEKEEMQLRKKFNLTGEEVAAGEGVIKQDVKGGVLGGLSLKKGQTVTIVRLDNNPPNKWLIRSETGMGYIDSSNIEVDPNIIRQAMAGHARGSQSWREDSDHQPVYDDVPQGVLPHDGEYDEEIYEECP